MPFQIPITNIKNLSNAIIVDSVPPSQLLAFYLFVDHIYKHLRAKKLRFHDHMHSNVKSNMGSLAFKDNYLKIEYSRTNFISDTDTILD